MKTYEMMMSNLTNVRISASSASDAIQSALMKNPGHTVSTCECPGMTYDVPKHKALTPEDIERLKPKRQSRPKRTVSTSPHNIPAIWIQDWMDKQNRK